MNIIPKENIKEYLLEFIRQFHRKEGRVPLQMDFNKNLKYPSFGIYQKVFGSWNNAIKDAGLLPNCGGGKYPKKYKDEELLKNLIRFYEENGRPPSETDFTRNPKYPSFMTCVYRFGGWQKALKIVGLDTDSMVRKGIIETEDQKARLGEIFVLEYLKKILMRQVIDLSGENKLSRCDGRYSEVNYDAKTASFDGSHWHFALQNDNIDEIEWFYLLAFDKDYTKLPFAWRIPALDLMRDIDKGFIHIGLNDDYNNNLENLKEYEITGKIKPIFEKWRNNLRKWAKEEMLEYSRSKLKTYVESKKSDT